MYVYIACFDISDDRTRREVGKRLERYGTRVQRSVFEITVHNQSELETLRDDLGAQLSEGDDLRFYNLCKKCRAVSRDHRYERIASFPVASII